jgi:hypothetical protein
MRSALAQGRAACGGAACARRRPRRSRGRSHAVRRPRARGRRCGAMLAVPLPDGALVARVSDGSDGRARRRPRRGSTARCRCSSYSLAPLLSSPGAPPPRATMTALARLRWARRRQPSRRASTLRSDRVGPGRGRLPRLPCAAAHQRRWRRVSDRQNRRRDAGKVRAALRASRDSAEVLCALRGR